MVFLGGKNLLLLGGPHGVTVRRRSTTVSLPVPPRKSFVPRFLPPRTMINRFTCTTAARRQTLGCGGAWRAEKTPLAYKGVPSEGAHPVPAPTYPRPSRNTPFAHAERVAVLSARILHFKRLNGALWCVFYAFFGAHAPSLRASAVSAPVFFAPHALPSLAPLPPASQCNHRGYIA